MVLFESLNACAAMSRQTPAVAGSLRNELPNSEFVFLCRFSRLNPHLLGKLSHSGNVTR
jgi:hypothetical protein